MNKPIVVLLVDHRNWAFDYIARSISSHLKSKYRFDILYTDENPKLDEIHFDLLYVFFWGNDIGRWHIPKEKVIKEVASLRWMLEPNFGMLSTEKFVEEHLRDAAIVTTPARMIYEILKPAHEKVLLCPNGFEPSIFNPPKLRKGSLVIGWVGNPNDKTKGLKDILIPATEGKFDFRYTSGNLSRAQVSVLYKQIDVIAIASLGESQPLPLIEGMASGCFPVSTRVGIVPEMVVNGANGLVVERSVESFRQAFEWCAENIQLIRSQGSSTASSIKMARSWQACSKRFDLVFEYALSRQKGASESSEPRITETPNPSIEFSSTVLNHRTGKTNCSYDKDPLLQPTMLERIQYSRWLVQDYRVSFRSKLKKVQTKVVSKIKARTR